MLRSFDWSRTSTLPPVWDLSEGGARVARLRRPALGRTGTVETSRGAWRIDVAGLLLADFRVHDPEGVERARVRMQPSHTMSLSLADGRAFSWRGADFWHRKWRMEDEHGREVARLEPPRWWQRPLRLTTEPALVVDEPLLAALAAVWWALLARDGGDAG